MQARQAGRWCTARFSSTTQVLAKGMSKYYRISQCDAWYAYLLCSLIPASEMHSNPARLQIITGASSKGLTSAQGAWPAWSCCICCPVACGNVRPAGYQGVAFSGGGPTIHLQALKPLLPLSFLLHHLHNACEHTDDPLLKRFRSKGKSSVGRIDARSGYAGGLLHQLLCRCPYCRGRAGQPGCGHPRSHGRWDWHEPL